MLHEKGLEGRKNVMWVSSMAAYLCCLCLWMPLSYLYPNCLPLCLSSAPLCAARLRRGCSLRYSKTLFPSYCCTALSGERTIFMLSQSPPSSLLAANTQTASWVGVIPREGGHIDDPTLSQCKLPCFLEGDIPVSALAICKAVLYVTLTIVVFLFAFLFRHNSLM